MTDSTATGMTREDLVWKLFDTLGKKKAGRLSNGTLDWNSIDMAQTEELFLRACALVRKGLDSSSITDIIKNL